MRARRAVLHAAGALLVATLCLGAYGLVAPRSAGLPSSADGTNADAVFSDADVRRVLRDYGMTERAEAPADSLTFHTSGGRHV